MNTKHNSLAQKLVEKFSKLGLQVEEDNFFTSAMSTAKFLKKQKYQGRAFVIGEECLKQELRNESIFTVDEKMAELSVPDFVVVGESSSDTIYNYSTIDFAIKLVRRGARLIGTNEDVADCIQHEVQPGTGSLIRPIEAASGFNAYFVGKPNPIMIHNVLARFGDISREETVLIGDRMNTDVKAGVEAGVDTVLVLSGVTTQEDILKFAYRPTTVLSGVGDIAAILGAQDFNIYPNDNEAEDFSCERYGS